MASCKECVHIDVCRGIYLAAISGKINSYEEFLEKCDKEHFEQQDLSPCDCLFYRNRSRFVELPYSIKPRDKVWYILDGLSEIDLKEYAIKSGECAVGNVPDTVIEVGTLGFWVNQLSTRNENYLVPDDCDFISWDEIGKSYFLSKEEAKQALKERENNG